MLSGDKNSSLHGRRNWVYGAKQISSTLSRKGYTTDLEWGILKAYNCCANLLAQFFLLKLQFLKRVKMLLLWGCCGCVFHVHQCLKGCRHKSNVCSLTAWETRCAVGWRGLRKPELYFWLCQGPGAWPGERHSASPCLCFLSCLHTLHTLQAVFSDSVWCWSSTSHLWRAVPLNIWW